MSAITTPVLDLVSATGTAIKFEELLAANTSSHEIDCIELLPTTNVMPVVVLEFAMGKVGSPPPTADAIGAANRVVQAAQTSIEDPDIVVNSDGELAFYFRLPDGRLLMAELDVEGTLWVGVHDDHCGTGDVQSELIMPAQEDRLIGLFKQVP